MRVVTPSSAHDFMDCTPEQQNSLLEELAYKAKFSPPRKAAAHFSR